MPEGIQVEESFSTRRTHQPHPQMLSAYMCADCSMWAWQPPHVTLNMTLIHPLDAPNWRQEGIMWAGIATSKACDSAKEEASSANSVLLSAGSETSDATFSDSWVGSLETVVVGVGQHFLGKGGTEEMEVWDTGPLRSL